MKLMRKEILFGLGYKLSQSPEQEAVKSLLDIMDGKNVNETIIASFLLIRGSHLHVEESEIVS